MNVRRQFLLSLLAASLFPQWGGAQELPTDVRQEIGKFLDTTARKEVSVGRISIDSVAVEGNTLQLFANMNCAYIPFREDNVAEIYQGVSALLPAEFTKYKLQIRTNKRSIEELVPQVLRSKKDKKTKTFNPVASKPLVTDISAPYTPTNGLQNRHIALWQSHGWYYEPKLDRWEWQRARIFQTVEDLYTQSYVLPFLVPMLENAGANVLLPRERDCQTAEVIVDNDGSLSGHGGQGSLYLDVKSRKARWEQTSRPGFAQRKRVYQDNENPFLSGTARFTKTEKKKDKAFAEWVPDIPETGEYAVYVSYQTLPGSVSDAKYLVFHNGGVTEFKVNQQIGSGTWVYLGTFTFDKGRNDYGMVVLSNESKEKGVVCADAVRFGGGMGNIARGGQTSGLPRYLEGARYFAQWAGMPYPVYGGYEGKNDMNDDINVRSRTVNYLAGKSLFNPTEEGYTVPTAFAQRGIPPTSTTAGCMPVQTAMPPVTFRTFC